MLPSKNIMRERERERERERTLASLLLTTEEQALQPLMYNLLNDSKHSRPGISTSFSQLVRFRSHKFSKFERSEKLSNAMQFETFTSCKLDGSGGRVLSSLQWDRISFLRMDRPLRLEERLQK